MPGEPFDVLLDDYLRVIMRARPWARPAEEVELLPFADWLRESERSHALADDLLSLAATYAKQLELGPTRKQRLLRALCHLLDWWHIAA